MQTDATARGDGIELRLTVWPSPGSGWRARVVGPDASEREFASPFELARYVSGPFAERPRDDDTGLR